MRRHRVRRRIATALAALAVIVSAIVVFEIYRPAPPMASTMVLTMVSRGQAVSAARHESKPPQRKFVKAPAPLSAFAQEQQMSFSRLMNRWNPTISEAAKRFRVPQVWIRAVMEVESGGRTMMAERKPIVSSMGAMGLMQLMPQTYDDMRRQYGLGPDPYNPHDNILAGAAYLRALRDKYGYPAMFAAYNDGPGNLEARLMGRGLLPVETQNYIVSVTNAVAKGGAMVKFTRPNGVPAMINAAAVSNVRAAFPGEYAPGVQSVITVGRLHQGVRESVAQVRTAIRAHGGGI